MKIKNLLIIKKLKMKMKIKNLLAIILLMLVLQQADAQSIKVVYETQPKMEIKADGLDPSMIEQIRKSAKVRYQLCYKNGESVYRTLKSESSSSSGNMVINIQRPEDVTYRNHSTKKEISKKDFFGKDFLITTDLKAGEWTITDTTKVIQDYLCQKALLNDGEKEMAVWFCPNLPIKDGAVYTGLEGLVLGVETKQFSIFATEISEDVDCKIEIPKKGKKISAKEYKEMVEKRMEAMKKEGNSYDSESRNGMTVIRISR